MGREERRDRANMQLILLQSISCEPWRALKVYGFVFAMVIGGKI